MLFVCPVSGPSSFAPLSNVLLGNSSACSKFSLGRNGLNQPRVTESSRRAFFAGTKRVSGRPSAATGFYYTESASPLTVSNTATDGLLDSHMFSAEERVRVLSEALPYMQKFTGKTFVIKYGGAAMKDSSLKEFVIRDLVFLSVVGIRPIFVHGGGPEINQWLSKVGIEPVFKNGLRVTDGPTMEVVEMVLTGKVNKELVALINAAGGRAVGLSGKDGKLVIAEPEDPQYGFVGFPKTVNPQVLDSLTGAGYIPVVASVAADEAGQSYNINADTVAGEIAAALNAEKLILLTDVPGIMKDFKDLSTLISRLTISEAKAFIDSGVVSGGMIPKVKGCINVLEKGVNATHIIDGKRPHSLLLEIFTDGGIGSMVTHDST